MGDAETALRIRLIVHLRAADTKLLVPHAGLEPATLALRMPPEGSYGSHTERRNSLTFLFCDRALALTSAAASR